MAQAYANVPAINLGCPLFRLPEILNVQYPETMTTAEHIHSIASSKSAEVTIAGVPWPLYKVVALAIGLIVALVVGVVSLNAAPAVLAGAGAATLVWLVFGSVEHYRGS
jgi:hypothetical protein